MSKAPTWTRTATGTYRLKGTRLEVGFARVNEVWWLERAGLYVSQHNTLAEAQSAAVALAYPTSPERPL